MSIAARTVAARALRYERKFVIRARGACRIDAALRLHPARFEEAFPPRFVNNVYFDTLTFRHYFDGVDGEPQRRKFRLRWYGPLFGSAGPVQAEIKRKQGHVGSKLTRAISGFEMKPGVAGADLARALAATWSQECDHRLEPVLMNRYHRRYWISRDGRFRITVDSDVHYHRVARVRNLFLLPVRDDAARIIELKYDVAHEADAGHVARAVPYRLGRHSKYVAGVDRLYGHLRGVGLD